MSGIKGSGTLRSEAWPSLAMLACVSQHRQNACKFGLLGVSSPTLKISGCAAVRGSQIAATEGGYGEGVRVGEGTA